MACICEGTSKSEILPLMMSRDQENINGGTRLQMHTDPAIYDGSDLRVRLELTKPFQQADLSTRSAMTNTGKLASTLFRVCFWAIIQAGADRLLLTGKCLYEQSKGHLEVLCQCFAYL